MPYNDKPTTTQYVLAVIGGLVIAAIFIFCFANMAYGLAGIAEHLGK